jgi:hypothetical protein
MPQYLVGFDRFIALEWANYAFELSLHKDSQVAKVSQLKSWLSLRVSGKDATRKTANVLTRLWLDENPDIAYFHDETVKLRLDAKKSDFIFFHWGMALLAFPFFFETCTQTGRLILLQSKIARREVQVRMAEKYSNQGTVPRSVDRVLQSLVDWGVLERLSQQELGLNKHLSTNILLKKWLLECVVFSAPHKRIPLQGFYKMPALFPFEYTADVGLIIGNSTKVKIERDGNNSEYIIWRST